MNTTTVAAAKAPSAAAPKPSKAITAARRLATEKQTVQNEIERLTTQLRPLESGYDALERAVKQGETEQDQRLWNGRGDREALEAELEAQQAQLRAAGEALTPIYAAIEERKEKLRELEARVPALAEETLRTLHPLAVQTQTGLQRLDEIEARLTAEQANIRRDSDPEDESKLKELESVSLRLSVIPGKRDCENGKLIAQIEEMKPFCEAARHELSRRLSAREQLLRALFLNAVQPFFEDAKVPSAVEHDFENMFQHTQSRAQLREIEVSARGTYTGAVFTLAAVPPLLAAFDALAKLETTTP